MHLPPEVESVTKAFLDAADEHAPGLVEGLYLHGSLGFGEYIPGSSDVDFVAVLACRPDEPKLAGLAAAHDLVRTTFTEPRFEGVHLVRRDLAGPPTRCPDVPCVFEGEFRPAGRFSVNPVTWHELAWHGITVRGQDLAEMVWTDPAALRSFTQDNLTDYWSPIAGTLRSAPPEAITTDDVTWCVLGVSRLHHLLARGSMTSKSGAGRHALAAFGPRWRPIVSEALRAREHPDQPSSYAGDLVGRGRDTAAFMTVAIEAGMACGL